MKLTGPACTEAMNEAEEARRRERAEGNAGGVRVELRVRATGRNLSALPIQVRQAERPDSQTDQPSGLWMRAPAKYCLGPVGSGGEWVL